MSTIWATSATDVAIQVARAVGVLQRGQPLRRVYVLTPPGSTATTLRRLLPTIAGSVVGGRPGTGIGGIRFTTIPDLALELAPVAVRRSRPITPLLLSSAVQAELDRQCPAALTEVREHPATVDALVQVANRLRSLRLATGAADVVTALTGRNVVRRAIVEVAVNARRSLLSKGLRDEASVLSAATGSLADASTSWNGPLVVVATDAVHPAQLPFLRQLLQSVPDAWVVASEPEPSDEDFIAQLTDLVGRVRVRPPSAQYSVTSSPDQDEEARWVVRQILSLVTGPSPTVPEDIAVFYPPASGYARGLREELERAGVFSSGPAIETLAGSMAGQIVRILLGLFLGGSDRDAVLQLVTVAPVWPRANEARRNVARWRRLCRQANIVVGADWATAADRLALAQRARRQRRLRYDDTVDIDTATPQDESDLRSLASLAGLVTALERSAAAFRQAHTWEVACQALLGELARHLGTLQWRSEHWNAVPVWQRHAADQVEVMLSALRQFDNEDTALTFSAASLRRIVTAELDQQVRKSGDTTVGVRVLPLQHGCCADARHVFITGANEGVLPPGRTDDLVIPAELTAACASVVEHGDWHRRRLRRAWHALTSGGATVTVTLARTDLRRGGALFSSEWLGGEPPCIHPSHAQGVRTGAVVNAAECAVRRRTNVETAAASPVLHRRAFVLASRAQAEPTVFDGLIGAHQEHDPALHVQAITNFESHATCGLAYFVKNVLGVDMDVDASEITEIQARERGTVVHSVLEQLVAEWLDTNPAQRPAWMQDTHLQHGLDRAAELLDCAADVLEVQHKLGHTTSWAIERGLILTAIEETLRRDRRERVTPLAVELGFGEGRDVGAHRVETPGFPVWFGGSIDRIDLVGDRLRVTDFKTSNAGKQPSVSRTEFDLGRKLQPGLYTRVVADHAELFGALPSTEVTWQYAYLRRGHGEVPPFDQDLLANFDEPISERAELFADGDFRPASAADFPCGVCTPDGLGRGDIDARIQQWNAFAADVLSGTVDVEVDDELDEELGQAVGGEVAYESPDG